MKISVVGKVHRTGISKSGRHYDFVEIHFVAPLKGVEGDAAQTVTIDPEVFPYSNLGRGLYEAEFDSRGRMLSLTPVQAATGK